jgi:hypothetical protein
MFVGDTLHVQKMEKQNHNRQEAQKAEVCVCVETY